MVFCSKITELITIKLPIKNNTLGTSPKIRKVGNPWPDTPMAEYMDHLKGKARKDAGEMLK